MIPYQVMCGIGILYSIPGCFIAGELWKYLFGNALTIFFLIAVFYFTKKVKVESPESGVRQ